MMNNNNCSIMGISPNFSPEVKQIDLPDYGPLDADLYRSLLRAGPGMCEVIKKIAAQISNLKCAD